MCGRFSLTSTPEALAERFGIECPTTLVPRYNIAPTQESLVVRPAATPDGARRGELASWGFGGDGDRRLLINARAETVAEKPSFRDSFARRRCLVPADGFYEWADRGGFKQPYFIAAADRSVFGFAGLWERWRDAEGTLLESCTLLTREAAPELRDLHDRMPIMVPPSLYGAWLDPGATDPFPLLSRLDEAVPRSYHVHPVSTRVNRAELDDADCVAPAPEPPRQESLF